MTFPCRGGHGVKHPRGFGKDGLLRSFQHLCRCAAPGEGHQGLQRVALLRQALPQLIRGLRQALEGSAGRGNGGVLVRVQGTGQLAIGIGNVLLTITTLMGSTKAQNCLKRLRS